VIFNFRKSPPPASVPDNDAASPAETMPLGQDAPASGAKSWFSRLRSGLKKSSVGLAGLLLGARVDDALFDQLEDALIMADSGLGASSEIIIELRSRAVRQQVKDAETLQRVLAEIITERLRPLERRLNPDRAKPFVIMMTGINGAGKTTSIGKLAKHFQNQKRSVLLAAGDTFRAAAREQLTVWGERNGIDVISQQGGDPAAVVFDAIAAGKARRIDVVLADTAGRLPTQQNLMDELKKIKRVMAKADPQAPHEVILVIDGTTGQNALHQVRAFNDAVGVTGLIVTKLDGSAKGGVLLALAMEQPTPIYFIGVGESLDDLQPFVAREFANALLDLDPAA
jgi:fused signal recognition particle receptor